MAAIGRQPLPRAILALRVAVEGLEAPEDICSLMLAVDYSMVAEKPRKALNLRFTRLSRARRGVFRRLSIWLKTTSVKQAVRESGAQWSWLVWRRAVVAMHRGVKPHAAFGMDKGGRPKNQNFTLAEDAAIYALHLLDIGQALDQKEAIATAATLYQARVDETVKAIPLAVEIGISSRADAAKLSAEKRGEAPKTPKRGVTL